MNLSKPKSHLLLTLPIMILSIFLVCSLSSCRCRPVEVCGMYWMGFHPEELEDDYLEATDIWEVKVLENLDGEQSAKDGDSPVITPNMNRLSGPAVHARIQIITVYKGDARIGKTDTIRLPKGWSSAGLMNVGSESLLFFFPEREGEFTMHDFQDQPETEKEAHFRLSILRQLEETEIRQVVELREKYMRKRHFPRKDVFETVEWVENQIGIWYHNKGEELGIQGP